MTLRVLPSITVADYKQLFDEIKVAGGEKVWAEKILSRVEANPHSSQIAKIILMKNTEISALFPSHRFPQLDDVVLKAMQHTEVGMLCIFRLLEIAAEREAGPQNP